MAAVKAGKLDGVEGELSQVATLLSESADFRAFINDPSVPSAAKTEGLSAVLTKMGATDITKNFVSLLTDNNRLGELPRILDKFEEIAAEQRGEVRCGLRRAALGLAAAWQRSWQASPLPLSPHCRHPCRRCARW